MVQRGALKRARQPALMAAGAGAGSFDGEGASASQSVGDPSGVAPESDDEVAMVRTATEVLGIDHVARWMQSKIPSLGNQTPYALIQTENGRRQVSRVLLKIEHGVY